MIILFRRNNSADAPVFTLNSRNLLQKSCSSQIRSKNTTGKHKLIRKDGQESVVENGFWQGTLIYMVIGTGEEIDPNQIVDHRTDVVEEYNETFVESSEIESLW